MSTFLQLPPALFFKAYPQYIKYFRSALPRLLSDSRYLVRYRANPEAIEIGYASDKWHIK